MLCVQVRQVSAQVHDIRGKMGQLAALLRSRSFDVTVHQAGRAAAQHAAWQSADMHFICHHATFFCLQVRQVSVQVHDIRGSVGQLAGLDYAACCTAIVLKRASLYMPLL
jgi:hypothetical protein